MDHSILQYYSFTRSLLSFIGLWPYQSANIRRFLNPVIVFIFMIFLIIQLTPLTTKHFETIEILKNISPIFMTVGAVCKYIVYWQSNETMKEFMEQIQCDWESMNDEELKILQEHAYLARRYSVIFALFVYPTTFCAIACHFTSEFLDIVSPLNETRPHWSPIETEYFIDPNKYFYLITLYQNLTIFIGGSIFVATESLVTMWLQHNASLFKVICYRIHEAVQGHNTRRLVDAVMLHRKVAKATKSMWSILMLMYSILIILGVAIQSINLFRLSQSIVRTNDIQETLIAVMFITTILGYMFYTNYMVQQMFDSGDSIFTFLYDIEWYKTSISTQRMLLFIMLKASKASSLTVLFSYHPSIEGFSMLLKTTLSYFMVIYSAC